MNIQYPLLAGILLVTLCYAGLAWKKLLPSVDSLWSFSYLLNSPGGNILILAAFSIVFFISGTAMFVWCLNRAIEGKLSADNAVMMMGLTWITGSCFGGSFASMLKVMGAVSTQPNTSTTTSNTTVAEVPKVPVPEAEQK